MFTLRIKYRDGNSFGTYEESDVIPYTWETLDKAIAARDKIIDIHCHQKAPVQVVLELEDGTEKEFFNFWDYDHFTSLISITVVIDQVGEETYV